MATVRSNLQTLRAVMREDLVQVSTLSPTMATFPVMA